MLFEVSFDTKSFVFLSLTEKLYIFSKANFILFNISAGISSYIVEPQDAAYVITLSASSTFPNNLVVKPHSAILFIQLKTSSLPITHMLYFAFVTSICNSLFLNLSKAINCFFTFFFTINLLIKYISIFSIFFNNIEKDIELQLELCKLVFFSISEK